MPPAERTRGRRAHRAAAALATTPSRAERRQAARTRRNRLLLAGSAAASAVVLVAWFPASALVHQHQQLASAATELDRVRQENAALHKEASRLRSPSEVARIAEEQYDLAAPGEANYQVLPASGSTPGAPTSTTTTLPPPTHPATTGSGSGGGGFVSRVLQTLEFWR